MRSWHTYIAASVFGLLFPGRSAPTRSATMTDGQLGALRCSKKRLSSAAEHGPRNMQLPRIAQERNFQSRKLTKCKPDLEYINKYFSCTLKMETSNVACVGVVEGGEEHSIAVNSLTFAYPGCEPFISDFTLKLPKGSRCLLVGANGAGKTTLLQVMAGKYMVNRDAVRVLGRPAFHDLQLTSSGELSYLGSSWRRDVAFAGYDCPLQGDIGAGEMIFGVEGIDPARREKLIQMLDVDLDWRLNTVSDGQRRRVQICMGLLKPYQVLLLDEITVDMDVLGRLDLLDFFREECEERGATIIYATHIFDGLEPWITHIAYAAEGKMLRGGTKDEVLPADAVGKKLLGTVESWLREDYTKRQAKGWAPVATSRTPSHMASKHMAYYR